MVKVKISKMVKKQYDNNNKKKITLIVASSENDGGSFITNNTFSNSGVAKIERNRPSSLQHSIRANNFDSQIMAGGTRFKLINFDKGRFSQWRFRQHISFVLLLLLLNWRSSVVGWWHCWRFGYGRFWETLTLDCWQCRKHWNSLVFLLLASLSHFLVSAFTFFGLVFETSHVCSLYSQTFSICFLRCALLFGGDLYRFVFSTRESSGVTRQHL